jgi:hypothetical protein
MADDREHCRAHVWDGWGHRRCLRWAWKDGYCKQHHPDSVEKRREESERRYEEKRKRDPWIRLGSRVRQLESFIRDNGLIVPPVED